MSRRCPAPPTPKSWRSASARRACSSRLTWTSPTPCASIRRGPRESVVHLVPGVNALVGKIGLYERFPAAHSAGLYLHGRPRSSVGLSGIDMSPIDLDDVSWHTDDTLHEQTIRVLRGFHEHQVAPLWGRGRVRCAVCNGEVPVPEEGKHGLAFNPNLLRVLRRRKRRGSSRRCRRASCRAAPRGNDHEGDEAAGQAPSLRTVAGSGKHQRAVAGTPGRGVGVSHLPSIVILSRRVERRHVRSLVRPG